MTNIITEPKADTPAEEGAIVEQVRRLLLTMQDIETEVAMPLIETIVHECVRHAFCRGVERGRHD